jgi:SAM-dependent methyltransferase
MPLGAALMSAILSNTRVPIDNELNEKLDALLAIVDSNQHPNDLSGLWGIVKDIEYIKLNLKFFGYELAHELAAALPPAVDTIPVKVGLACKPTTQADMESSWFSHWCAELRIPRVFHRKLWEFGYLLQALFEHGLIRPNARGLGFGCGVEPIASYLASKGVEVTATDMLPDNQAQAGWAINNEYATNIDKVFHEKLVARDMFDRNVSFRFVNMQDIPTDLVEYDFCWSLCAIEHLGSIAAAMDFVERSLTTLKPGGLSIHTTEFNFLHDDYTIDNWVTVYPQRQHFIDLAERLRRNGHWVAPLNFDTGQKPLDRFFDMAPWFHQYGEAQRSLLGGGADHLKLAIDGIATTCFGLIVRKGSVEMSVFEEEKGTTMSNEPAVRDQISHPTFTGLKSLDYGKAYYDEHVQGGLDYLGHGYWHESYGRMVTESTMQTSYDAPFIIDAGCACGSILQGFKKTGSYKRVLGVDLSEYMIGLGRSHFGYSDDELVVGSITDIPVESGTVSLLHSAQVLEHLPEEITDAVLNEFARVLRPGGRAFLCLDAIRTGENKEMYLGDPTHVNIQPLMYWTKKLHKLGLMFDVEAYNNFVRSERGPTQGDPRSFYYHYPYWSAWTLIKE